MADGVNKPLCIYYRMVKEYLVLSLNQLAVQTIYIGQRYAVVYLVNPKLHKSLFANFLIDFLFAAVHLVTFFIII